MVPIVVYRIISWKVFLKGLYLDHYYLMSSLMVFSYLLKKVQFFTSLMVNILQAIQSKFQFKII